MSIFADKGTTKNVHLQTKLRKVYFQRNFVCKWAALCDRSFGGIVPNLLAQGGVRRYNCVA